MKVLILILALSACGKGNNSGTSERSLRFQNSLTVSGYFLCSSLSGYCQHVWVDNFRFTCPVSNNLMYRKLNARVINVNGLVSCDHQYNLR